MDLARIIACLLLFVACATSGRDLPEVYRTGTDPRYAPERYIIGIGRSRDLEDARRRAVISIGGQVQATLRSEARLSARSRWQSDGDGTHSSDNEEVFEEIRQQTHFSRPDWVRVVETHRQGDEVWVLAVLDRQHAASSLHREMDESIELLRKDLERAEAVTELTALARLLDGLRETSGKVRQQRVLLAALGRRPPPPAPELEALAALEGRFQEQKRSVVLWLCLDASEGGELGQQLLAGRLAALGVRSEPCPEEAPDHGIRIEGRIYKSLQRVRQAGAYPWFCTLSAEFRAFDAATGALLHGMSEGGVRRGGMQERQACSESLGHLARELAQALGLD